MALEVTSSSFPVGPENPLSLLCFAHLTSNAVQ